MKKGFTLIELLAVIIILAIIALIATPIILNVVGDAKKSAGQSEANMVLKGITDYCEQEKMGILKTTYCKDEITLKENLDKIVNLGKLDKKNIEIEYNYGNLEWIKLESNGHIFSLSDGKMVEGNIEKPSILKTYNVDCNKSIKNILGKDIESCYYDQDRDKNVRFVGKNPNNYVSLNNELWRIVGSFIKKDDYGNVIGSQVKIIRNNLYTEKNSEGFEEPVTNLWWTGNWSNSFLGKKMNYDKNNFYSQIDDNSKKFIDENYTWNLSSTSFGDVDNLTTIENIYELEQGNVSIDHQPVKWNGAIGLIYLSDYLYATSVEFKLLNEPHYFKYDSIKAFDYNWLSQDKSEWTLTQGSPENSWLIANNYFRSSEHNAPFNLPIRPALFLKENVKIVSGGGTIGNPYILGI